MRVGIDASLIELGRSGGIETYCLELVAALRRVAPEDEYVLFCAPGAAAELRSRLDGIRAIEAPIPPTARWRAMLAQQVWLPLRARAERVEVLHHTANYGCRPHGFRSVLTLHDTIYDFYLRQHLPTNRLRKRLVRRMLVAHARQTHHVIAVSRNTAREIQSMTGVNSDRITVTPLAPKHLVPSSGPPPFGLRPGYFLSLARLDPHKNLERLVCAHLRSGTRRALVLAGLPGWKGHPTHRWLLRAAERFPDRLRILGAIDESSLASLYQGARAFVFPSLVEGFGLPPLEAAWLGVPVALSDIPVLREVMAQAARFFDPWDVEQMAQSLCELDRDDHLCARLAIAGRQRAADYDWRRTARITREVYEHVMERQAA